jgi:tripartite-type tricarboxylate transporter receptor subunit TctC
MTKRILVVEDQEDLRGILRDVDTLDFNFIRDIVPVASIHRAPFVMVVNSSVAAKTVPEFIACAKAKPGQVNMASFGPDSGSQLFGELFKVMVGVVPVQHRGVEPALPDLMSGRVDVIFVPVAAAIGYIGSGKLRPLGVTTTGRVGVVPDVPTIGEFVPGYEWTGIGAPANTPPEIIAILNKHVNAALADPTFKARLVDLGMEPFANSPIEFGKFVADYTEKWGNVIRAANIKPE